MRIFGLATLFFICVTTANAAIVENQQYFLLDHPDGGLVGSHGPYGLRIDAIAPPVGAGPTFSTQLGGASAILEWTGTTASIMGTLWNNTTSTLWTVDQQFTDVVAVSGGFQAGAGTLTLIDEMDNMFVFDATPTGNVFVADDSGHRCGSHMDCGPLVARGWVIPKYGDFEKDYYGKIIPGTNDWLVQLTPVPVPAALPLLISGLLGFTFFSRRKATAA